MTRKPAAPLLDRTLTYRLHRLHKLTDLESQRRYPEVTGLSLVVEKVYGYDVALQPKSSGARQSVAGMNLLGSGVPVVSLTGSPPPSPTWRSAHPADRRRSHPPRCRPSGS